ncbi:hypothetical protein CKO36_07470 [Rhabdochromatium marinum]|nr:hypothetical protein [Rhabdochromatium marinum]
MTDKSSAPAGGPQGCAVARINANTPQLAIDRALALRAQARNTWQRRLLLLEGEAAQTLAMAQRLVAALHHERAGDWPVEWIGRGPAGQAQPASQTNRLLGCERDLLVYDLFSGLEVDALAVATGTLRGGGLLILLGPPLEQWAHFDDPAAARIATYPYRAADVGRRFLMRMASVLTEAANGAAEPAADQATNQGTLRPGFTLTTAQHQVLVQIRQLMTAAHPYPLVVTAGRGRGKSTALGLAAAEWCNDPARAVLVTAPRFEAARTLLEAARTRLEAAPQRLRFLPPDQLARAQPATDLLLVDEAAGIPAPLLRTLLDNYPRIVFATTTQGYEGTGSGFALRFFPLLEQLKPGWQQLELQTPVRFAAHDPLEALIHQLLLLDAEPATAAQLSANAAQPVQIEVCERWALSQQDERLRQLFGLLRLAHYQTRPSDLRDLLDGPNLSLMTLSRGQTLLATALIAREGALDETLSAAIFAGERRPRGHLLPQTLSAHAGLAQAPVRHYARIVRIATHPLAQRQGLGRRLLAAVLTHAADSGVELIGASFGATASLLPFWRACGFTPVQLGSRRNAATGAHAAVVLRALRPSGQALLAEARARFPERLLARLPGHLRALEPALVLELLRQPELEPPCAAPPMQIPARLRPELYAFAYQQRSLEAAWPVLIQLAPQPLIDALERHAIGHEQAECFIALVLQQQTPEEIAPRWGYSGRAELIRVLRQITAAVLECHPVRHGGNSSAHDHSPDQPPASGHSRWSARQR